jgi:hypothetical protein
MIDLYYFYLFIKVSLCYFFFDLCINIYILYNLHANSVFIDSGLIILYYILIATLVWCLKEDPKIYIFSLYLTLGTMSIVYVFMCVDDMITIPEFHKPQYIVINIIKIICKLLLTTVSFYIMTKKPAESKEYESIDNLLLP